MASKPIVMCADDFGLASGVSDAICGLIEQGRLSATSAMTSLPAWRTHAPGLREVVARRPADVGLHLTLTDQPPAFARTLLAPGGRFPGIGQVLKDALRGRWHRATEEVILRAEVRAQLDAFEDAWGKPPDYVDGHQHVHILPGIRGVLLGELQLRYDADPQCPRYLRDCGESPVRVLRRGGASAKALVLDFLSIGFRRAAASAGFATNQGFSGLHDFSGKEPFDRLMRRFLSQLGPRPLVHVHPGVVDAELMARDNLTAPRETELAYLTSEAFARDLEAAGVWVAPFSQVNSGALQVTPQEGNRT